MRRKCSFAPILIAVRKTWSLVPMLIAAIGFLMLAAGSVMNLFDSFYKHDSSGNNGPVYGIGFLLLIVGLVIVKPGSIDKNIKRGE